MTVYAEGVYYRTSAVSTDTSQSDTDPGHLHRQTGKAITTLVPLCLLHRMF